MNDISVSRFIKFRFTRNQTGIAYLSVLILVAILSMAAVSTVQVGAYLQRRSAEEELLKIGAEFRNAFVSYASATPAGKSKFPASLEELLQDPRYPNTRRHLRKIYVDPITGKDEWLLITAKTDSGISGVSSTSNERPIKVGNFDLIFQTFEGASSYQQWQFLGNSEDVIAEKSSP